MEVGILLTTLDLPTHIVANLAVQLLSKRSLDVVEEDSEGGRDGEKKDLTMFYHYSKPGIL
jgi:hypothetical protein